MSTSFNGTSDLELSTKQTSNIYRCESHETRKTPAAMDMQHIVFSIVASTKLWNQQKEFSVTYRLLILFFYHLLRLHFQARFHPKRLRRRALHRFPPQIFLFLVDFDIFQRHIRLEAIEKENKQHPPVRISRDTEDTDVNEHAAHRVQHRGVNEAMEPAKRVHQDMVQGGGERREERAKMERWRG